jgi:L-fuculose-phosphate aldolase
MEYMEQRKAIIDACLWLEDKGMVFGSWGNVSLRLNNSAIMVTPSRVAYREMKPQDIVIVDMQGSKLEGERKATSEMHVHRLIMQKRPDIGAVVHSHSMCASALCATGEEIPPIFEEMSQMLGGSLPITKGYVDAGRHLELGVAAAEALGDKNAVLLWGHGPVCAGRDLPEALVCCQVVEKAARCYLALKASGLPIRVIPEEQVKSERHRFLHSYAVNP